MTTNEKAQKKRPRGKGTGSIFKPKGSRFWWIAYVSGGIRRFEGTKSEVKGEAQTLLTSRLGDVGRGIAVTPKMGRMTVGTALKAVIDNQKVNGRQSAAQTQQRVDGHLLAYFAAERLISTITTSDLEAYQTHRLIEQKAERATVNRELAIVRRAFRLAVRGGALASMPFIPMLAEDNARQGFFERAEFDAILGHLPDYLRPPLTFMYTTGWRKSEVFSLTIAQVDLAAGIVRLEVGTTKSGEGRSFYVTEELRTLLQAQLASIAALQKRGTICPWGQAKGKAKPKGQVRRMPKARGESKNR